MRSQTTDDVAGGEVVLFFGIIDLLQEWTLAKEAENFLKSKMLRRDGAGLSAVKPQPYAQRFLDSLGRRFVN